MLNGEMCDFCSGVSICPNIGTQADLGGPWEKVHRICVQFLNLSQVFQQHTIVCCA